METSAAVATADLALPGYRGSRGAVLLELKRSPGLVVRDLARRLALSDNAVRHHLKELEAEGLIVRAREQRGVGAPSHAWHLSPLAEGLFPTGYAETLTAMLDEVTRRDGRAAAVALLEAHFGRALGRIAGQVEGSSPAERVEHVARIRTSQGYMAEGAAGPCCGTLVEHHCPIRVLAERYPEVCAIEERHMGELLGGHVERRKHLLGGDAACEYRVRFADGEADARGNGELA